MIHFISKRTHNVKEIEGEVTLNTQVTLQDVNWIKSLSIIGIDLETNHLDPYIGNILLLIIGNKERQYVIDTLSIDCENLLLDIINPVKPMSGVTFGDTVLKGIVTTNKDSTKTFYKASPEIILDAKEDIKRRGGIFHKLQRKLTTLVIGANIKFDYKFIKVKWDIELVKMFDVMIAEQRLNQGLTEFSIEKNKRVPLSAALDKIVLRRLGNVPDGMNKAIREEFIGVNPSTFIFETKHIVYAANDIIPIFDIRIIQKAEIAKYGLNFLIYNIEFPLIKVIADCELEGMNINEVQWKENIAKNKELKFDKEVELDNELRRLRDTLLSEDERKYLKNDKYDRIRVKHKEVVELNLFGEEFNNIDINAVATRKKKTIKKGIDAYINYDSPTQVVTIFGRLKQLAPTINAKKQSGAYQIPTFILSKGKHKVNNDIIYPYRFTTGAKAIESYKAENPYSKINIFISRLVEFRQYVTLLGTFGEEFLKKYKNRITNRYHTVYRQCDAVTGRAQSGDERNGYYNSQNLPRKVEYRKCFHYGEDWIITTDLSGAEAVIMIDKARDEKFYEIAIVNDDAHSPLCQAVWRAIGKYRVETCDTNNLDEAKKLANIVISKKVNSDKRTDFKPHTFGHIYGMGLSKESKTLGVSIEEAKIAGATQRGMIPKTYKMVEKNAKSAVANGYLVLNNRTNSRMWYSEIIEAYKNNQEPSKDIKHAVESSAKNGAIQGTQADMLKEIMVEISKEAERQDMYSKYGLRLLKQVHDETVYKVNKEVDINLELVEFIKDGAGIEMVTIPEFIKKWHMQVCNRYLSFITMSAEQKVGKTWEK